MVDRRGFIARTSGAAALAAVPFSIAGAADVDDQGRDLAEALIAAMGGRDSWLPLLGLSVRARHYEADIDGTYDNALFIALAEPRMRFEGRSETMNRVRVVVGNSGWRVSEVSPPGPLSEAVVKSDLEWWETHVYRNVWRLAHRDPSLLPRRHTDGRLELFRSDGTRLMWYRLNTRGEPVGFGRFANDATATILGPLQEVTGGVRLPTFSSSADGTFRAVDQRGEVYRTVPPVDYLKP